MIELLLKKVPGFNSNIAKIASRNRLDLIKIAYSKTDAFLEIDQVLEYATRNFPINL